MSTPVQPSVIRGPAVVIFNSYTYYVQGDITVTRERNVNPTMTDMFGNVGDTLVSETNTITFTPAGEVESAVKYFPYGPSNLVAASSVGSSIYGGACVIHTKAGQTISYNRAGISAMPTMTLSPRATWLGSMSIKSIGSTSVLQTDAAFYKTIASASFTDTSFDASKIIKDIYKVAIGARSTPYDAIGARAGFEVRPFIETSVVEDDNVGIADEIITSVGCEVSFEPNNLTEAQIDTLLNSQDTNALLPGQFIGRGPVATPENLVISSTALTVTAHNAGLVAAEHGYGSSIDRNKTLRWVARSTFTSGAPNPTFSIVVN